MKIVTLVYEHESTAHTHLLYLNEKEVVAFDAGQQNDTLIRYLTKRDLTLKAIFLTHGHYDHIRGLKYISDNVPVYIFDEEKDFLENPFLNCSKLIKDEKEVIIDRKLNLLKDLEEITFDDAKITLIHTPFHTSGSVVYLINNEALISGDTLFKGVIGRSDLPTSSVRSIENSLSRIIDIYHKYGDMPVCPGHGENTTLKNEIERNPYLKQLVK